MHIRSIRSNVAHIHDLAKCRSQLLWHVIGLTCSVTHANSTSCCDTADNVTHPERNCMRRKCSSCAIWLRVLTPGGPAGAAFLALALFALPVPELRLASEGATLCTADPKASLLMLQGLAGDPPTIPPVSKPLQVFSIKLGGLTGEPKSGPTVTAESAAFVLMLSGVTGSLTTIPIITPTAPGLPFGTPVSIRLVGNLMLHPVMKPGNDIMSLLFLTLQLLCLLLPAKSLPKIVCLAGWKGGGVFSCPCCVLPAMMGIDSLLLAAVLGLAARGLSPMLSLLPAPGMLSSCWQHDMLASTATLLGRVGAGLCCTDTQAKVTGRLCIHECLHK